MLESTKPKSKTYSKKNKYEFITGNLFIDSAIYGTFQRNDS